MSFEITPQHRAIYDWCADPARRALIIQARAGSGKSTTLIEMLRLIPPTQSATFLAFNKSAATEIGEKAARKGLTRDNVDFRTLNSAGFRAVARRFKGGRINVDGDKVVKNLRENLSGDDFKIFGFIVRDLVSAAKSQGLVPAEFKDARRTVDDTDDAFFEFSERFQIDAPGDTPRLWGRAFDLARKVLTRGLRDASTIDFDDQLYLPFALRLPFWRVDWLLVDEAQDLNVVQRVLLRDMVTTTGKLVAVGDNLQSIYGWRGSDCDSLGAIAREYGAETMPLSVTYRCPTSVVAIAKRWAPDIEAAPNAPAGMVSKLGADKIDGIDWRPDDLVICRNNAPIVRLAFRLIRRKVPCRVAGRDIGTGLRKLIDKLGPVDLIDLVEKIRDYQRKQQAIILKRNPDADAALMALDDKCETIHVLAEEATSLADLRSALESMFDDVTVGRLTLSSIHRAKGAEAPRVFVLDPHLMPSRMARTADAKQQERNLMYVAVTRAREELVYLTQTPPAPVEGAPPTAPALPPASGPPRLALPPPT